MARRFAFVSFGVLCLMVSALIGFHIGGRTVKAQAPGSPIDGFTAHGTDHWVINRSTGDVWQNFVSSTIAGVYQQPATYAGNFWTGTVADWHT